MNASQFLLIKLSEECAEVSQRALKQIQFGPNEIQKEQDKTNKQRLKDELLDLLAVTNLLIQEKQIEDFQVYELREAKERKKIKMQKYLDYSYQLGELPKITL
jgi:NTP pyrophosphatase (non-canonical NTP hydrolase)